MYRESCPCEMTFWTDELVIQQEESPLMSVIIDHTKKMLSE